MTTKGPYDTGTFPAIAPTRAKPWRGLARFATPWRMLRPRIQDDVSADANVDVNGSVDVNGDVRAVVAETPPIASEPTASDAPPSMVFSRAAAGMTESVLQEVRRISSGPDILSFALGMPANDLFPAEALAEASKQTLAVDRHALQYALPHRPLKEHIVKLMEMRGVRCRPQNIFLTAGAQQGMDLVARLLLDPEGPMMLEDIVYEGMQTVTKTLRPQLLTVPTSAQHGMDVDAVELALASGQKPAFIYAITDGHNPLGGSLPMASRWRLVELARRYGVPILEDDAYGYLYYDDQPAPPMRAINDEWVFYLGSFSKILAPALRVGWLVVPEVLQTKLAALKQASDIDVANYSQRTIATYLDTGVLPRHLDRVRAVYRTRRDAMLDALTRHFPAGCRWNTPSAGLYLWVELPEQIDALELLRRSIEAEKIAFTPGKAFALRGRHHANHCMRLAFGNVHEDAVEDGIARLAQVLRTMLAE